MRNVTCDTNIDYASKERVTPEERWLRYEDMLLSQHEIRVLLHCHSKSSKFITRQNAFSDNFAQFLAYQYFSLYCLFLIPNWKATIGLPLNSIVDNRSEAL